MSQEQVELLAVEADAELLAKFVECNDRVAIESLIVRYAPMVGAVCRVTAQDRSDVEDAFQATFLVLLQSARKVRKQSSIAAWLHGVAFRIASRARTRRRKQQMAELNFESTPNTISSATDSAQEDPVVIVARKMELERLVEEIERLPTRLRPILVEHYLMGHTLQEIASRMELSSSAVEGRLRRGRRALRDRLIRQGISLSIALGAVGLLKQQVQASESSRLCGQFLNHQLNNHFMGLTYEPNTQIGTLVRGELAMNSRLVLLKTAAGAALVGALGLAAPFAALSGGRVGGASGSQIEIQSVPTELIANQAVADQPNTNEAIEMTPTTLPSTNEVLAQLGALPPPNQEAPTPNKKQNAKHAANKEADTKDAERVVNWARPGSEMPSWLQDSDDDLAIAIQIEKNRQALKRRVPEGFQLSSVPLSRALESLSETVGCTIYLDKQGIIDDGLDFENPIDADVRPCSLRSTLEFILTPLNLGYRVTEAGIEVTTQAKIENSNNLGSLRCYDLSHIFQTSEPVNKLISTIQTSITPDSWLENGGNASMSMVGSMLIVRCSDDAHFQIEELLRSIAKMTPGNLTPPPMLVPGQGMGGTGGGFF
jgi:RNA polymerase sigma factor (sigma-70 family)